MVGKKLTFVEVKKKIEEHVEIALGIKDFSITFAKYVEYGNIWKVNIEYDQLIGGLKFPTSAAFSIDAETGELREYFKGRQWSD